MEEREVNGQKAETLHSKLIKWVEVMRRDCESKFYLKENIFSFSNQPTFYRKISHFLVLNSNLISLHWNSPEKFKSKRRNYIEICA